MNDCKSRPFLVAYYDGELDERARRQIEEHLRDCPACCAELAEMRELSLRIADASTELHGEASRPPEQWRRVNSLEAARDNPIAPGWE